MWICLNDAFISVVQDRKVGGQLVVRARSVDHLKALFPDRRIYTSRKSDYVARCYVTKREFADFISEKVIDLDYDNFKSSVKDVDLHNLYADFWWLHRDYQLQSPYRGLMAWKPPKKYAAKLLKK